MVNADAAIKTVFYALDPIIINVRNAVKVIFCMIIQPVKILAEQAMNWIPLTKKFARLANLIVKTCVWLVKYISIQFVMKIAVLWV